MNRPVASSPEVSSIGDFDHHADTYRDDVEDAISWSGKDVDYFAKGKADLLLALAQRLLGDPAELRALDVGCGVGVTDRFLAGRFGELHGVDIAADAVEKARESNPEVHYEAYDGGALPFPDDALDIAFTICVFHHVPPPDWPLFASEMTRVVRPGGLVAVFEHNPLNPLTRRAVSGCEFDRDADLLGRREALALLSAAGLPDPECRYIVFFPREGRLLRRIERRLGRLPLGAQYTAFAQRS